MSRSSNTPHDFTLDSAAATTQLRSSRACSTVLSGGRTAWQSRRATVSLAIAAAKPKGHASSASQGPALAPVTVVDMKFKNCTGVSSRAQGEHRDNGRLGGGCQISWGSMLALLAARKPRSHVELSKTVVGRWDSTSHRTCRSNLYYTRRKGSLGCSS